MRGGPGVRARAGAPGDAGSPAGGAVLDCAASLLRRSPRRSTGGEESGVELSGTRMAGDLSGDEDVEVCSMDLLSRQCSLRASASRAWASRSRSSSLSIPSNTAVRLGRERERELLPEPDCDCRALGGVRSSPGKGADRGGVRGAIGKWSQATSSPVEAG